MNSLPTVRIASFDIGKKNFAQYVEDVNIDILVNLEKRYKSLPKSLQRRTKGKMNPQIEQILEELYLSGTRVQMGVYDLRDDDSDILTVRTRVNLLSHLEKFIYIWDTCDIFIIEQQYFKTWSAGKRGRGTEANVDAIKIGEGTLMWFLERYPLRVVDYFGSQNKTQILGAPWGMSKPQRKEWAAAKMREIHEKRSDRDVIELFELKDRIYRKRLNTEEKIQDYLSTYHGMSEDCKNMAERIVRERQTIIDIGDACTQAQSYKYKMMVACF